MKQMKQMNIQRIRNLTTGILHTRQEHVQEDLEFLFGHELPETLIPEIASAIMPWLREKLQDERLFNPEYDPNQQGDVNLQPLTKPERESFWRGYLNNCPRGHATSND